MEIHNVNLDALLRFTAHPQRAANFFWQANTLLQMPDKGQYWLNLPADQLLDAKAIDLLLALRHQQRLTIEIQDPLTVTRMSAAEQRGIHHALLQLGRRAGKSGWMI